MADCNGTLEIAADLNAIAALVYDYAECIRNRNGAACGALFAQNAFYEIKELYAEVVGAAARRRQLLEGREAIAAYIGKASGGAIRVCPLIHNLRIDLQGDAATSTSMLESRTFPAGGEFLGEYIDSFRKQAGRWQFSSRIFTLWLPGRRSAA